VKFGWPKMKLTGKIYRATPLDREKLHPLEVLSGAPRMQEI